ncbi:hypothetical protein V6N11_058830 [Hibiscus sabdariffa]|uniref:RNase H type-1 domain-containing protein n=1 Tax=Hibiscus sabdariffa TaxID=183260 RepID=A0ABR2U5K4_9ROSI
MESVSSGGCAFLPPVRDHYHHNWEVKFQHVLRSGNKIVDRLAKMASQNNFEVRMFWVPPTGFQTLLYEDNSGHDQILGHIG